jgi:hypothetical protein
MNRFCGEEHQVPPLPFSPLFWGFSSRWKAFFGAFPDLQNRGSFFAHFYIYNGLDKNQAAIAPYVLSSS